MRWSRSHTVTTTALPERIWARWTTAQTWSLDDPSTTAAHFPEPPQAGDRGTVSGIGGTQKFVFTEIDRNRQMTFRIRLPGARLVFPHSMEQTAEGLRVTHAFWFDGPLAFLYGPLIGTRLIRELPTVVRLLVDHAIDDELSPDTGQRTHGLPRA